MSDSFWQNLWNQQRGLNKSTTTVTSDTVIDHDSHGIPSNISIGPSPVFYESSSKDKHFHGDIIFISTSATRPSYLLPNHDGIYYYDTHINKWNLFCQYPAFLKLKNHNMCIDKEKKLLFVFGGDFNSFAILNLETNKWNVKVLS